MQSLCQQVISFDAASRYFPWLSPKEAIRRTIQAYVGVWGYQFRHWERERPGDLLWLCSRPISQRELFIEVVFASQSRIERAADVAGMKCIRFVPSAAMIEYQDNRRKRYSPLNSKIRLARAAYCAKHRSRLFVRGSLWQRGRDESVFLHSMTHA